MVAGIQEELDVPAQVVMAGAVGAVRGRFLERASHAFDLPVGPRRIRPGQPVLAAVLLSGVAEGVAASDTGLLEGPPGRLSALAAAFLRAGVGELDAIVGKQGVGPEGTASTRAWRKSAATWRVAFSCSWVKVSLLVRSMATNMWSLLASVRTSAMSMWK